MVNIPLECWRGFGKAKEGNLLFKNTKSDTKGSFLFISLFNTDFIKGGNNIQFYKLFSFSYDFKGFSN